MALQRRECWSAPVRSRMAGVESSVRSSRVLVGRYYHRAVLLRRLGRAAGAARTTRPTVDRLSAKVDSTFAVEPVDCAERQTRHGALSWVTQSCRAPVTRRWPRCRRAPAVRMSQSPRWPDVGASRSRYYAGRAEAAPSLIVRLSNLWRRPHRMPARPALQIDPWAATRTTRCDRAVVRSYEVRSLAVSRRHRPTRRPGEPPIQACSTLEPPLASCAADMPPGIRRHRASRHAESELPPRPARRGGSASARCDRLASQLSWPRAGGETSAASEPVRGSQPSAAAPAIPPTTGRAALVRWRAQQARQACQHARSYGPSRPRPDR